jgi:hypothetical protein
MDRLVTNRIREPKAFAFYDVSTNVKSWGRRGVLLGGIFGFALGVALVAIPFTSDVLTFGIIGTLLVAAVEGAVIAGAFAVCIAAFYGRGQRYSSERAYNTTLSDTNASSSTDSPSHSTDRPTHLSPPEEPQS